MNYIGRFAPSPTGLLHIGSLLTALASYADARSQGGRWLVRMEDLDPPREMQGAADHILRTLEAFGLEWDGEIVYQSQRHELYRAALADLQVQDWVYPCYCSRKDWHQQARQGVDGFVYNGLCAHVNVHLVHSTQKKPAWRLRVLDENVGFYDRIVGFYSQNLVRDIGDFVLLRADGFWAYQLAVVVDDAEQGITHIVRGQDLLVSTPRQIHVQRCLNLPEISYAHLPLLTNHLGQKWSKQTCAPAIDARYAPAILRQVMTYLNIPTPPSEDLSVVELVDWTVAHWSLHGVPNENIITD